MKRRVFGRLILLLALALLASGIAVAEEESFIFYAGGDVPNPQGEIINFKGRLNEYGFYISGISDTDLRSTELDPSTLAAVQQVTLYNPDLQYYPDRVSYELYWRVMGLNTDGKKLVTPANSVQAYKLLAPGANDAAVSELQTRLSNLGYDASAGFKYTADVYDDELDRAVQSFVELNNLYGAYDPEEGITPQLQEKIFQEEPEPVRYVAPKQSLPEKVRGFVLGGSMIAGVRIPNIALMILGFALLCAVVILVMRLVAPRKSQEKQIHFRVEYNGEVMEHSVPIAPVIEIGRTVGSFPLNVGDSSVSRNHGEIRCGGGQFVYVDHSRFGTRVNGELCHNDQRPLHSGDVLEIGQHRVTVQIDL